MKNLNDYLEQWFGAKSAVFSKLPVWQETLERTAIYKNDYENWLKADFHFEMLSDLANFYNKYILEINSDEVRFINRDLTGGFMWYVQKASYSDKDFNFFFDFLSQKIQNFNYKVSISDIRFFDRKDYAETIERHYLKPRIAFTKEKKAIQLFGNIHIELYKRNDKSIQLKFLATAYNDFNYDKALSFSNLMGKLTSF